MSNLVFKFEWEAFGTKLSVSIWDELSPILLEKIKLEIFDYTNYFDENFSRFKTSSLVSSQLMHVGVHKAPTELVEMLNIYIELNKVTQGKVNPYIGNTISDLGYDSDYTLRRKEVIRKSPSLEEVISILDTHKVIIKKEGYLLDLGAIGKGYWVDSVCKMLDKYGLKKYLVDGSGDLYYKNSLDDQRLRVGLQVGDHVFGYTEILNESICGSGISKRDWSSNPEEQLHHVIDPDSSESTKNVQAVWVKHRITAVSDGAATALFFINPEEIQKITPGLEYLTIDKNKKILISENFNAVLF